VRLDALDLGIETTANGCVFTSSGILPDSVYAFGPVKKASLWETTAVAEIRVQAILLANLLLEKWESAVSD